MKRVETELQDLTYLPWDTVRHSAGTAGTFLKAEEVIDGKRIYYKISAYDPLRGIVGHECVNEIIADRLLTSLRIPHLSYRLIHGRILLAGREYETFLCASDDYKKPGERKIAFDDFFAVNREPDETVLSFCARMGFSDEIYKMFTADYLLLNKDRHGANAEVLKARNGSVRLAPLFDHGSSLLYDCTEPETLTTSDFLADPPVNDFFGTGHVFQNLGLVPREKLLSLPKEKEQVISGLFAELWDVMPKVYLTQTKRMLEERWKFYEVFRNQK